MKKSKIKMYLEKHLMKTVWSNVLREKTRLLLTVLKNIFLITHSSICDLLLSWVCLPSYLCQCQHQSKQSINSPRYWSEWVLNLGKSMLYINSTKTLCRLQKLILTVPILLFHMLFKEKNGFCFWLDGMHREIRLWPF